MNSDVLSSFLSSASAWVSSHLPGVLLSLATLVIGLAFINRLVRVFAAFMRHRSVEPSLQSFATSFSSITLKVILVISVASMLGVQTTSFVAILGAAGLAVGLALQGSLGNFAGGVLILLFRPFKVGDVIEAQGFLGKVKEIQVFCTILNTPDNRRIILPNGPLAGGSIVNISAEETRRVDFVFGISYSDDIAKTKQVLNEIAQSDSRIFNDPQPVVAVLELADSSVNLAFRVWCKSEVYWDLFFDIQEKVKTQFDRVGISIPFPQRDLHLHPNAGLLTSLKSNAENSRGQSSKLN